MMAEMDKFFTSFASTAQRSFDRTAHHDQYNTYLCHSYGTISAFRQAIIHLLNSLNGEFACFRQTLSTLSERYKIQKKIRRTKLIKKMMDREGSFSFHAMLTVFVGCVNPRSFIGLQKNQSAVLGTVVSRLVQKTAFEIEGWKRILPVRALFEQMGIKKGVKFKFTKKY